MSNDLSISMPYVADLSTHAPSSLFLSFDIQPVLFLVIVVLPIVFALYCLYNALQLLKVTWILKETPPSKIRGASQGYVEMKGVTEAFLEKTLIAPLTLSPAVWYRYSIEEWKTEQNQDGVRQFWDPIEAQITESPFIFKDDTGECVIFPENAEIHSTHYQAWTGYDRFPQKNKVITFWSSFWNSFTDWFFGKPHFRYQEWRIEPNTAIQVTGFFSTMMHDDPKIAKNNLLQEYLKNKKGSEVNLVSNEFLPEGHQFLISTEGESKLIKNSKLKAWVFFAAFLFFCAVSASSLYPLVMKAINR